MAESPKSEIHFVTSYNQSGGITAHTVNMEKPGRHINDGLKQQLDSLLPKEKRPIVINSAISDRESYNFGAEIAAYLRGNGWSVEQLQAMWSPPLVGQRFRPEKDGRINIDIGSKE